MQDLRYIPTNWERDLKEFTIVTLGFLVGGSDNIFPAVKEITWLNIQHEG